jgi:hypothetical protein
MNKRVGSVVGLGVLLLSGCLHLGGSKGSVKPPTCRGTEQCAVMWELATAWVAENSALHIRTATPTLIVTENGGQHSPELAMQVSLVPTGGGRKEIRFKAGCSNMFGCARDPGKAADAFYRHVGRAAVMSP